MKTKEDKLYVGIGRLIMLALFVPGIPWRGWVFAQLWRWFFVPLGLPAIVLWHAYGLMIVLAFAMPSPDAPKSDKPVLTQAGEMAARVALFPAMSLLFGYIAHRMMQP
jgi:hypothetical protein